VVTGVLGGRINIESALGAGTNVRLILPRRAPQRNSGNSNNGHEN
jgi:signal transduction histidine kinase